MNTLKNFLNSTSINTVGTPAKSVINETTAAPVTEAFRKLYSHKLHALPIVSAKDKKYVSFFDLGDVLAHLMHSFSDDDFRHIPQFTEWHGEFLRLLDEKDKLWAVADEPAVPDPKKVEYFRSKTVGDTARLPFASLKESATLKDAIDTMLAIPHCHRVAVVDQGGDIKRIVSNMDVMKFLSVNLNHFGTEKNMTLADLKLDGHREVIKINRKQTALQAFRIMAATGVNGIAVVDDNQKLVGHIGTSDLKLIFYTAREFINLYLPLEEYLKKVHGRDASVPNKDVSRSSKATLADVINVFATLKVHRIFLVNDAHEPTGVVTIGDLLQAIKNTN